MFTIRKAERVRSALSVKFYKFLYVKKTSQETILRFLAGFFLEIN